MTGPDTSRQAADRQADADFGLFGTGQQPDGDDAQADEPGAQPGDVYDPTFFQV